MREYHDFTVDKLLMLHVVRARAFYYKHKGKLLQDKQGLTQEVRELYNEAAKEYKKTLIYYPPDEQYNICK